MGVKNEYEQRVDAMLRNYKEFQGNATPSAILAVGTALLRALLDIRDMIERKA